MNLKDALRRIRGRRAAYRRIFLGDDGKPHRDALIVLNDLKKFCRANYPSIRLDNTGAIDPQATPYLEGRREVWLRLMQYLHIDDEFIYTNTEDEE